MIFRELHENNGWMFADYTATWNYGYDFMLDVAQTLIDDDFQEKLQRLAVGRIAGAGQTELLDQVLKADRILRNCPSVVNENGVLIVSGISRIMECPLQIMLYNQTNAVRLCTPIKAVFEKHGEHVFDNYMNSMEIKAYCRETERRTMDKLRKDK